MGATTTTMSSKGQVIIPREVRRVLHWDAGTQLLVEADEHGVLLRAITPFPAANAEDLIGCVGYRGRKRTLAEMDAGIARGARGRK